MRTLNILKLNSSWVTVLSLLAGLLLGGCSRHYVFEDLHAIYQSPEIPTVFANDTGGWQASGSVTWNSTRQLKVQHSDTIISHYSSGSTTYTQDTLHPEYRFNTNTWFIEGTFAWAFKYGFFGITAGAAMPDVERFKLGGFLGYSQNLQFIPVTPFISVGMMATRVVVTGSYWVSDYGYSDYYGYGNRDRALEKHVTDICIPIKLGLMFRFSPQIQPYVFAYNASILTIPNEQQDPARYTIDDGGVAGGVRNEIFPDWFLSLESHMAILTDQNDSESRHWKTRIMLTRQL